MDPVEEPYVGYRAKAQYASGSNTIVSSNPARPAFHSLSAFYLPTETPLFVDASLEAAGSLKNPGYHHQNDPLFLDRPYDFWKPKKDEENQD